MRQCDTAFSEGWGQIVTPLSVPTASGKKQITPQNNSHFRSRSEVFRFAQHDGTPIFF